MLTRTIVATISSGAQNALAPGGSASFAVISDTGPGAGIISSASLHLSAIRTYSQSFYLDVNGGGSTLAKTRGHQANGNEHSETVPLADLAEALLYGEFEELTLTVKKITGSANKINFPDGCTITIAIEYEEPAFRTFALTRAASSGSVTYNGTFGVNSAGTNGRSVGVSGQAIPSGMKITSINYTIAMSGGGYSRELVWRVHWFAIGSQDGSPYVPYTEVAMEDDDQVLRGSMEFDASDIDKFTSGNFTLYAKVNNNHSLTSYMGAFTITVNYTEDTGSGGGDSGGDSGGGDSGGDSGGGDSGGDDSGGGGNVNGYCIAAENIKVTPDKAYKGTATLTWEYPNERNTSLQTMYLEVEYSTDGKTWEEAEKATGYDYPDYDLAWSSVAYIRGTNRPRRYSYNVNVPPEAWSYYRFRIRTCGLYNTCYTDYVTLQRIRPVLLPYTDVPIIPGETKVKAIHMLELQTNINSMRASESLPAYSFSNIQAGYTGLANWSAHVAQMRAAIDEMGISHEAWISFNVNQPRADVIMQLRRVVAAL